MFYEIPSNLSAELAELDGYIADFRQGRLDAAALKAHRVPFGCYEQRRDGTFMVRIRTTGGALSPHQLGTIARISARYGASSLHVTTRQEFQIHDLSLEDVTTVMRELLAVGLASRGGGGNTVRNIMVSPEAGIGLDEVFDPSPHAFALTSRLISEGDSWLLPRKLKIAFSNSPADTGLAQFNDIGFIARIRDGVSGFRVYVAGGMGGKPEVGHLLHDFVPASDVYLIAEAVKRLFDKHGNRKKRNAARLRFLWNSAGEAGFRDLYAAELEALRTEGRPPLLVEDFSVEGLAPDIAPLSVGSSDFVEWKNRFVSAQRQAGLYSVLVPLFLGNVRNEDALRLADFLEPFGPQTIRATFGQNLRLRNIPEAYLGNVWSVLSGIGGLSRAPAMLANAVSCTGADTCQLGICLSKGALTATLDTLGKSDLPLDTVPDFRLHVSGCPNTCGQHLLADLGFFGNAGSKGQRMYPAYAVVAGARLADGQARFARQVARVSAHDVPSFARDVMALWIERKAAHASFADYIDNGGEGDMRTIAERYREIPDFRDDRSYYVDWGASEPFSLAGRGSGECAAGLFDLIELDLKAAARLRDGESGGDLTEGARLQRLAFLASRALLITRGVQTPSDASVFEAFRQHFLQSDLISPRFGEVVNAAERRDEAALLRLTSVVSELLSAVESLYQSMDNSLRFPAESSQDRARSAG
ncbi:nitrite/sulfite reductase [Telmatospirillum siberiense]|nr:nitrite/sulfite reductase [Telmatospirillum siberiense]